MMEEGFRGLIERIRAEGNLIRNSGTNSIKSLKEVSFSIEKQLIEQTAFLETMVNLQTELNNDLATQEALKTRGREETGGEDRANDQTDQVAPKDGQGILDFLGLGLLSASIAATAGIISGSIRGVADVFSRTVTGILRIIPTPGFLADIGENISNRFSGITTFFRTVTEGLRNSIATGFSRLSSMFTFANGNPIGRVIAGFRSTFDAFVNGFRAAGELLSGILRGPISYFEDILSLVRGYFSSLGSVFTRISGIVSRMFWPIAVIIGAVETVRGAIAGYAEDNIWGALEGAVTGLFNALISAPLDLLRSGVAWILDRLGFDETASVISNFSFEGLANQVFGAVFDGLQGAVNVIRDLFSFGDGDRILLGTVGTLTDIVFAPLNMAINFVTGLFGWTDPEEPFQLQDFVSDVFSQAISWVQGQFANVGEHIGEGFGGLVEYLATIPERIQLFAEEMWENLGARLQIGFARFSEWFGGMPDRIRLYALEILPDWMVSATDLQEARDAVNARSDDLQRRVREIEDARDANLSIIEERAAALDRRTQEVLSNMQNSGNYTDARTNVTNNTYNTSLSPASVLDPAFVGAQ
jgi:hypothetical protein